MGCRWELLWACWGSCGRKSDGCDLSDIFPTQRRRNTHIPTTGLDPPFLLYFPRLVKRTILRLFGWGRPCSPGCDETFSSVFLSRDSIIWWCMTHHYSNQERNRTRMQTRGIDKGGNIRRIGGWGGELEEWKVSVGEMVKSD